MHQGVSCIFFSNTISATGLKLTKCTDSALIQNSKVKLALDWTLGQVAFRNVLLQYFFLLCYRNVFEAGEKLR